MKQLEIIRGYRVNHGCRNGKIMEFTHSGGEIR